LTASHIECICEYAPVLPLLRRLANSTPAAAVGKYLRRHCEL